MRKLTYTERKKYDPIFEAMFEYFQARMAEHKEERWVTTEEACSILHIGKRQFAKESKFYPRQKIGKRFFYASSELIPTRITIV